MSQRPLSQIEYNTRQELSQRHVVQYHIPPSWSWNATASGCSPYCCFASQFGTKHRSPWWTRGECEGCRSWRKQRRKSPPDRLATSSEFLMEARKNSGKKHGRPWLSSSESLCKFRKSSPVDVFFVFKYSFPYFSTCLIDVWIKFNDKQLGDTMRRPRPLALLKDATTWLRSKVLHRPAVAPPEDDSNASAVAAETKAAETKPALSEASQKTQEIFPEMKSWWLWWSWHVDGFFRETVVDNRDIWDDMELHVHISWRGVLGESARNSCIYVSWRETRAHAWQTTNAGINWC